VEEEERGKKRTAKRTAKGYRRACGGKDQENQHAVIEM
jgi:hypothetical protein